MKSTLHLTIDIGEIQIAFAFSYGMLYIIVDEMKKRVLYAYLFLNMNSFWIATPESIDTDKSQPLLTKSNSKNATSL